MKIGTIKKKVEELDQLADEIENLGIEIIQNIPLSYNSTPSRSFRRSGRYIWNIPSNEVKKTQRSALKSYQKWYSISLQLVEEYLPQDRIDEFKHNYNIVLTYLQPSGYANSDKNKVVDTFINKFDIQRNIFFSIPDVIEIKEMNLRKLISADFVETELDEAEILFKNNYTRAAGTLARVALEKHLKTMCDLNDVSYKHKDTINTLVSNLYNEKSIDKTEFKKIQYLADIGNDCSHPNPIDENRVQELIDGAKKFIMTY